MRTPVDSPGPLTEHTIARTGLSRTALVGQAAVVTGAGRGIGFEAARSLAWLGAWVVIAEFDEDSGRQVEQVILAEGGQALFVQTDVSSEASVAALVEKSHTVFGPVEVLVNNAIQIAAVPVADMDVALWDRILAVNLRGTFLTCKAFLPDMLARQRGVIVNMISAEAMPGLAAYIATKQGIAGFSQSLALEVGDQGIRVIPFGPGMVDTPGLRGAAAGLAPRLGMSPDQFLNLSLHPAYEGLMPAEHAGVATAYLIAALADEYHGEMVTGYAVLERAGIISPDESPDVSTQLVGPVGGGGAQGFRQKPSLVGKASGLGLLDPPPLSQSLALAQRLGGTIAETEAEFNRLPVFVRPMARSGFKSRSGQSLQEWARTAQRLAEQIQRIQDGEPNARAALLDEFPRLWERLDKLAEYYQGVPSETARFTRDPQVLRQVEQLTQERLALIQALQSDLDGLHADRAAGR